MSLGGLTKPFILVGASGHARVLADLILAVGGRLLGVVDRGASPGAWHFGIPMLGDDAMLADYPPEAVDLVLGIGAMPGRDLRASVLARLAAYSFPDLIHPSACVAREVHLGGGAQVMAGVVIQTGCRLGAHVIVNTRASLDHDCELAEHAHIAPGAVLCGDVRIGARALVGPGAVVARGVRVGAGAVIGAGASVVRDVPEGARVIPAALRISA
jgi:UDP-perosamine 4-acetyltransferase